MSPCLKSWLSSLLLKFWESWKHSAPNQSDISKNHQSATIGRTKINRSLKPAKKSYMSLGGCHTYQVSSCRLDSQAFDLNLKLSSLMVLFSSIIIASSWLFNPINQASYILTTVLHDKVLLYSYNYTRWVVHIFCLACYHIRAR